ncbi:RluA family pseudouridine synthase [Siphonobacter aquaeclarae]|jgi:23S rRNA pseudouridine1911/1915/1917 synthase|uniref:23S rRNA pseudouridine1911/1915/1917 synthase n=1 Tax=Siphonobacter aquaeclarae TaxID=563176 RepID=A0A1G9VLZ3_9BACT|nr:RluA family pseudouridine synthase [Siphonobacter aquaeclarae]MBO9636822.1 RluA family pseudouridine synthase [Siphonobacter aquaeclarae]SDM73117.1 23S rRNA pseudouridine1911/1915/1917 synthase [Siphonobacter aquaeclarae]
MAKPFHVVYEDNHLIIVNKAAGVLVQGDETGDVTLSDYVKDYIRDKYEKPGAVFLGTVHRLDRPVSGLVVFARTSKALERMNELFRRRDIQKTYWAVVKNKPEKKSGKLTHWLVKDEARNVVTAYDYERPGAQKAELTYKLLGEMNHHYLLEVNPVTGRPHQIRVQLASMGCPIRGDLKYGYPRPNPDASINLHARRLFFIHPVKKEAIICKAALPANPFWEEFLEFDDEVNEAIFHG